MQLSHLNYTRLGDKYFLSEVRVDAHNSHRTIFIKELSFTHTLSSCYEKREQSLGSKVSWTPKCKGKIWNQGHWESWPLIREQHSLCCWSPGLDPLVLRSCWDPNEAKMEAFLSMQSESKSHKFTHLGWQLFLTWKTGQPVERKLLCNIRYVQTFDLEAE